MTLTVGIALSRGMVRQGVEYYLASRHTCTPLDTFEPPLAFDVLVIDNLQQRPVAPTRSSPVVLCADLRCRTDVVKAIRLGVRACVSVSSGFQHLGMAIQHACKGESYLCPTLSAVMCRPANNPEGSALTPRERDVLHWIASGYSSKQIGRLLGVSPHTVDTHRRSIMQKIGAHKVADLTRHAIAHESFRYQAL